MTAINEEVADVVGTLPDRKRKNAEQNESADRVRCEFARARVTDILLSPLARDSQLVGAGFTNVGKVNAGGFSKREFLWVRRDPEERHAIADLAVTTGHAKNWANEVWAPPYRGFKRLEAPENLRKYSPQTGNTFLWYWKRDFAGEIEAAKKRDALGGHDPIRMVARRVKEQFRRRAEALGDDLDLKQVFKKFARHNRDHMTQKEVVKAVVGRHGLHITDVPQKDVKRLVRKMDKNRDNKISLQEFLEFCRYDPHELDKIFDRVRNAISGANADIEVLANAT